VTFWVQKKQGAVSTLSGLPLECRVSNAIASFLRYVGKTVWPTKLAPFYPHPDTTYPVSEQWPFWQIASAAAVLVLVSLLVLRLHRSKPYLLTGWFWYLGMLVPVIGLVQVGSQGMADRYTYLPLIGLFIAGTWLVADTLAAPGKFSLPWAVSASAILAACGGLTWVQLHHWRDSIQLFEHTLAVTTKNPTAHFNLGAAWETEGKLGIALAHYRAALQLDPSYADARYNIAHALEAQGKVEQAVAEYRTVLEMNPAHLFAHNNLGNALLSLGKTAEAEKEYRESLRLRSDYPSGHNNLGKVLADQGRFAEASEHFAKALRLKPDYVEAQSGLALTLAAQGRYEEALSHWQRVALARPGKAEVQVNLGNVLTEMGKLEDARAAYALAVKLDPELERRTLELADHLSARGQGDPARARFILATRLNPQNPYPHERLGRLLAQQGRLEEAIGEFREVVRLRPDAQAFYNLGLVFVMQGRMEQAIPQYRRALELKADWPDALNDLAWILATDYRASLRNGSDAVQLASRACQLAGGREARFSGTLDAAYAETGDFDKAIATARQTEQLAVNAGQTNLASAARQRLELYQLQQPFRQKCPPTERSAPN
jgi:tetratricopeptide (TPR) repeat protein